MNRRKFIALTTAGIAAMTLPLPALAMRDDAPILQAMIDAGKPIVGGKYTLRTPIVLRGRGVIHGVSLTMKGTSAIHYGDIREGSWVFMYNTIRVPEGSDRPKDLNIFKYIGGRHQ